ncbi:MAG: hypothetical protein GY768_19490 [Planctomycetaceae bacterium]|nr:hypothetical protein [Planctomycetaceae bacterium]
MKSIEPGVWLESTVLADYGTSVVVTGLIFTAAVFDDRAEAKAVLKELSDLGFGKRFDISTVVQGGNLFQP